MSYDYDGMEVDIEAGEFTIFIGGTAYTYDISEHGDLLLGGIDAGVPVEYKEIEEADTEDIQDYYNNFDENENEEEDSFGGW